MHIEFTPSPITETPTALLEVLPAAYVRTRQTRLYQEAMQGIEKDGTITPALASQLKWYSSIVEYVLRIPELPMKFKTELALESPQAGFQAVVGDYRSELAQVLELSLLAKPEYVCKLLVWARENKVALRYPDNVYFNVLFNDFYWTYHYHMRAPVAMFMERYVKFHLENQSISPNSILSMMILGQLTPDEDQLVTLSKDFSSAYQACMLFREQCSPDTLLFEAALDPQWAFHILMHMPELGEDLRNLCHSTLDYHPPWLLEYLVRSDLWTTQEDASKEKLQRSVEETNHALQEDFKQLYK